MKKYPNLELLEYKAIFYFSNQTCLVQKLKKMQEENRFARVNFKAEVFPQMWGSTCLGFDVDENGTAMIGGSAMTEDYTTVMHEITTDTYFVFFGSKICYMIENANEQFFEDLKNHRLERLSVAKKKY